MAGETPCVEYEGSVNGDGYGVLPSPVHGSRLAHRAALAKKLGRPVVGVARHTCDNPPCVNAEHLVEGSQAQNMADAVRRGRIARGPRKDTCVRGHDVTVEGRGHGGQCNVCRKEDAKKQIDARRAARHARGLLRPTPARFRKAA